MTFDPRHVEILLAVTRAGSFSQAARELNLSQPSISAAIAQLERAAGVRLLDRGRHGAAPTRAGALLVHRAHALEHVLQQAQRDLELQARGVAGC
jgi:LysR family transcriptional regulator, regulator of abg operon